MDAEISQTSSLEDEVVSDESLHECDSNFSVLEINYRNITAKLQENEDLAEFACAYTQLFQSFYDTFQNEQNLIQQVSQLEIQILELREIITGCDKLAAEYVERIMQLKKELFYTKRLADLAHAREQTSKEIIENMRGQIAKLNNELELKSRIEGDDDVGALGKTEEAFEREKQRMIDEITSLKQKLTNALSYSEELEHKNSAADLKANEITLVLEQQTNESTKKQRLIEKLEGDINSLFSQNETLHQHLADNKELIDIENKKISLLETQLREQKSATEKATKHVEMTQIKLDKCQTELDLHTLELNDLKEKHSDLTKSCRLKNDECNTLRSDLIKLSKQKENIEKKLVLAERLKYNTEQERDQMRTNVHLMEREILISKKQADSDKRTIEAMTKEKEILSKNLMRVQSTIEGHMRLIKIQEQNKFKLEGEIHNLSYQIHQEKKHTLKLEAERNRAISETLDLTQQVEDAMDEINMKQKNIFDLKKMIAELETKLRQQQNIFEAIRAERNSLQKQVQEISSEATDLKSKLKICTHQGQQIKEDIAVKNNLISRLENMVKKLDRDKDNLKLEVQNGLNHIKKLNFEIHELRVTEKLLNDCILERDKTIKKKCDAYDLMLKDRDVIGAQLLRRNDEIQFLSAKVDILNIALVRGGNEYDKRIEDVKILKLEIQRLRQEKNYLSKSIANMTDLKTEVFTLEREIAQEKLKCRALEDELQHPLNIHRWRKLEGSDPRYNDLIKKMHILQKRHLKLTTDSIEREKQLKESVKLYINVREMLARYPGPDLKTELSKTKKALISRGIKMKCLVSELSMYETQVMGYKMDIDKISEELRDTKRKYFKQKKIYKDHVCEPIKLPAIKTSSSSIATPKFAGGGFKMA